jgi:hypothetical protein
MTPIDLLEAALTDADREVVNIWPTGASVCVSIKGTVLEKEFGRRPRPSFYTYHDKFHTDYYEYSAKVNKYGAPILEAIRARVPELSGQLYFSPWDSPTLRLEEKYEKSSTKSCTPSTV